MENIDIYYQSLKQVYDQIAAWRPPKTRLRERIVDWLLGVAGALLGLSLVPVLPTAALFLGERFGLSLWSFSLGPATFERMIAFWLVSTGAASAVFFPLLWINSKVDAHAPRPPGPAQTLSAEQLTFVLIYRAYRELHVFFVSHIHQHVENALEAIQLVLGEPFWGEYLALAEIRIRVADLQDESAMDYLPVRAARYSRRRAGPTSLAAQLSAARSFLRVFEKSGWFQFDSGTKSTFQALVSFPEKAVYRLEQREDLAALLQVLEHLSKFIYAYLPEHRANMDSAAVQDLQTEGLSHLDCFVDQVNALTQYSHRRKPAEPKSQISAPTIREKVQEFYYENVFFRFVVWFVLILTVTVATAYVATAIVAPVSPEAIVTVVIGSSVAGAAALAGFLPRSSRRG